MRLVEFLSYLNDLDIKVWLEDEKLKYSAPKGVMTPDIKQKIGSRKAEILDFLKQAKLSSKSAESTITPMPRDGNIPLSFAQQRLWFLYQLSPDIRSYNMLDGLKLDGDLDITALEKSLSELVGRHEILRTTFPAVDGEAIQNILEPTDLKLPIHDLTDMSVEDQRIQVLKKVAHLNAQHFDLMNKPPLQFTLLKLGAQDHILVLKMHHIIYDGWSLNIFFSELAQIYEAISKGQSSPLPALSIQYADFALWQRQWLTGEVLEQQLSYWQTQLAGAPMVLDLPSDRPRPPIQTFRGAATILQLDLALVQQLKQLSQASETTLFMTLLAAFFVTLSRHSGQTDLVIGTPIANRHHKGIEPLIGFFANTLALRGQLSGNPRFTDVLAQVRQTTLAAYAHQDLPFEMLVETLKPERDLSRNPLVQVMFSIQNASQADGELPSLVMKSMPLSGDVHVRFDLEVNIWETPAKWKVFWTYNADVFDADRIDRMSQHFHRVLQAIVANPETPVAEISLLTPEERHQLLYDWSNTQPEEFQYQCIHQLFEQQVERTPDAVALIYVDQQITYSDLNRRANQLAHYLQSLGVSLEDKVGICIERSPLMAIAILAILKAGAAYVPLDPAYPSERLEFMLQDVGCSIILTQASLSHRLPLRPDQKHIDIHSEWDAIAQHSTQNPVHRATPESLFYIIYTSGSTGTPKGTEVPHRSIMGFMFGVDYVHLDANQIWLQHSSVSWDAFTLEFWPSLLFGGRCVLYPGDKPTPEGLRDIIKEQGVNTLWLTCALFNLLIDTIPESLQGIKQLLVGGEALSVDHVHRALDLLPETQIINGYGPSECTVFSCGYPIPKPLKKNASSIPIGKPLGDRTVYLLDEHLQPVPVGVDGELYIGGPSVARGYLNQSELTNKKFIASPFMDDDILYKTGDLARYVSDGNIEFIGRIDHQVKLRGFRIELDEIETVLIQHSAVQVACVIVREDHPGEKRLVAYVVLQSENSATASELRQFLLNTLPGYMVPSAVVLLDTLPLTSNNKVDRRALKPPSNSQTNHAKTIVKPRNQLEFQLAQIWSTVLRVESVGVQDNFFELGGHSLLAPYVTLQIKQQLGKAIPLTALFQHPTVEQLAVFLQTDTAGWQASYLVPIQPQGNKPPFFCVPGVGGKPFYLTELGHYLGTDQPLYSFQAYDVEGELIPADTVEAIAHNYVQAIQQMQPQGPYYLGGHSFGGRVAFAMAQQLVEQGQTVARLVMIDIAAPTAQEDTILAPYYAQWNTTRWLLELVEAVELALNKSLNCSYQTLHTMNEPEQFQWALQTFKSLNVLPPNTEIKQIKTMMAVYKAQTLAGITYQPQQRIPVPITILRASERPPLPPEDAENYQYFKIYSEIAQDKRLGWDKLTSASVVVESVSGGHFSMVMAPHVQVLAERLQLHLSQA